MYKEYNFGNLFQEVERGFEVVPDDYRKHPDKQIILPNRGDSKSAGYDFYLPQSIIIPSGGRCTIWTDVCSFMQPDEVLMLYVRSSIGIKKGLVLANGTGIIDASYHPRNIGICLVNTSDKQVELNEGERIVQGIFMQYLLATNDEVLYESRVGGFGSSGA